MTKPIQFKCAALAESAELRVTSLRGHEALNRPFRFEIELRCDDPALPLERVIGSPVALSVGERVVDGIVAELVQGDAHDDGFGYRAVVVPRLGRLGVATRSRVFRDLTLPQIATAVAAAAGVEVELRLSRAYAVERFVVQYRETDLAFMSRLLEAEGVAFHLRGETLILSDDNSAFDTAVPAAYGSDVRAFRCTRTMMPRGLLLHDVDPAAETPLEARASVDRNGFGVQIEDGVALLTAEHGHAMAQRRAEGMRARANRYDGTTEQPVAAGQRLMLAGHFRADFNRDYIVVAATHELDAASWRTQFEAIAGDTVFRPEIVTPKPRITGAMRAVVDADVDGRGQYSVALPFDLGGHEGKGSQPLSLLSPDEGMRFTLRRGTPVVLDFIDGDPSRPLIAGAMPGRAPVPNKDTHVIRTPQGAIIEMSGSFAKAAEGKARRMDGALAELRPHTGSVTATGGNGEVTLAWTAVPNATAYQVWRGGTCVTTTEGVSYTDAGLTNGTLYTYTIVAIGSDDAELERFSGSATPSTEAGSDNYAEESAGVTDWIRFAVPHGSGKWSYLRFGESTTDSVASTDEGSGTFAEKTNLEGTFTSKYFDSDGEPKSDVDERTTFNWSALDDSAYNTNHHDKTESKGSKSYFDHASSAGVFDYTDGSRTTITRGDHQSVTEGHRTDVILGDYRLVIPCRTNGVYDADTYWMRFRKAAGSWRKTERSHVSSDSITWGDTESMFLGFTVDGFAGTKADVTFGGEVEAFAGYKLSLGAGISASFDFGHSFEMSFGKSFTSATKVELEASKHLRFSIPAGAKAEANSNGVIGLGVMGAFSLPLVIATTAAFGAAEPMGDAKWPVGGATAAASGLAFAAALAFFYLKKDRKVTDAEPSIEMTSDLIKLSIGEAAIELEASGISLTFGRSTLHLDGDYFTVISKETSIYEGDLIVRKGAFDVSKGEATVANKAIRVKP